MTVFAFGIPLMSILLKGKPDAALPGEVPPSATKAKQNESDSTATSTSGDAESIPAASSTIPSLPEIAWNTHDSDIRTNGNVELAARFLNKIAAKRDDMENGGATKPDVDRAFPEYCGQAITVTGEVHSVLKYKRVFHNHMGESCYLVEMNLVDSTDSTPFVLYVPGESEIPGERDLVRADAVPVGRKVIANLPSTPIAWPAFVGILQQTTHHELKSVTKSVGEAVVLRNLEFRVDDVWESDHLDPRQPDMEPHYAKSGKKFVVIDLSVLNRSNSQIDFSPDYGEFQTRGCRLRLADHKGEEYLTYNDSIWYLYEYLNYRSLPPGVWKHGYLAYEVPKDAGNLSLLLDNSVVVLLDSPANSIVLR